MSHVREREVAKSADEKVQALLSQGLPPLHSYNAKDILVLLENLERSKNITVTVDQARLLQEILHYEAQDGANGQGQTMSVLTKVVTILSGGAALGLTSLAIAPASILIAAFVSILGILVSKQVAEKLDNVPAVDEKVIVH